MLTRTTGSQGGRVFPSEGSPVNLAKEDWVFRRYLDMDPLWAAEEKTHKNRDLTWTWSPPRASW